MTTLIDVTDTAAAVGFHCQVSIEDSIPATEIAQVLTAAIAAIPHSDRGSWRVPFQILRFENGVVTSVGMLLVIGVDDHGRTTATIRA
ncbi:hypothetical protein ACWDO0_27990 [Nocardia rhamnosiphila]